MQPNSPRWDYVLVTSDCSDGRTALGMEVHNAVPREVEVVIKKKKWAEATLAGVLRPEAWFWLPSAGVKIRDTQPEARLRRQIGIILRRNLEVS